MTAPRRHNRQGYVLVTVLLLVTLLSALLLRFHRSSQADLQGSQRFQHRFQALNSARAGLHLALAAINHNDDIPSNATLQTMLRQSTDFEIGPARVSVELAVENSKINVNLLNDPNGSWNRPRIDQTLRLIDLLNQQRPGQTDVISYALVPALLDWTDPDDTVTVLPFVQGANAGAESAYYRKQQPPCTPMNRPFQTLDELLLVKGFTADLLYGPDHSARSTLPARRPNRTTLATLHLDNHPADDAPNLSQVLTVYGDGKIDLNTASPLVLQTLFADLDPALAGAIVAQRRLKPFSSLAELAALPGLDLTTSTHLAEIATVAPQQKYFRITARAVVQHTTVTLTAVARKNTNAAGLDIVAYWES